MKLSDAAVLGAATWERTCSLVLPGEDSVGKKGCFLQLAMLAAGATKEQVYSDNVWAETITRLWPWTEKPAPNGFDCHQVEIWQMNDRGVPFEEILAYVRANEPAEPEQAVEQCRCGQSFKTYDELLEHIATGDRATGPHVSVEAAQKLESLVESDRDWSANTR